MCDVLMKLNTVIENKSPTKFVEDFNWTQYKRAFTYYERFSYCCEIETYYKCMPIFHWGFEVKHQKNLYELKNYTVCISSPYRNIEIHEEIGERVRCVCSVCRRSGASTRTVMKRRRRLSFNWLHIHHLHKAPY